MTRKRWQKVTVGVISLMVMALILVALPACTQKYTAENPLVLNYDCWLPPVDQGYRTNQQFFDAMAAATGGAVKMNYQPGGAMGPGPESYNRVVAGISSIAQFGPGYTPGVFPMFMMFDYPIRFPTASVLTQAMLDMYEKGYYDEDFADVKVLGLYSIGPYVLFSTNKKISSIADLKGLKERCPSEGWVDVYKALGAVPVSMASGEQYLALQKGIIEGTNGPWSTVVVYKINEVCQYANEANLMTFTHAVVMNKDVWEELPQAAKDYLEANWKQNSLNAAKLFDEELPKDKEAFLSTSGREVTQFGAADWDQMQTLFAPLWDKWVADREAKGLPATKALNDLYQILTGLGVEKPILGYTPK